MTAAPEPQSAIQALLQGLLGPQIGGLFGMLAQYGGRMFGLGGGGMAMGGSSSRQLMASMRDYNNLQDITNRLGGMQASGSGVTGLDQAHAGNVLRGLGLGNVDSDYLLTGGKILNKALGSVFPELGQTSVTDLMGGLSTDFASRMYEGGRQMRGAKGWRLSNEEVAETTKLITGRMRGGPGGGLDFTYSKGMTLGEVGDIAKEMSSRDMLQFDPKKAGSVAEQTARGIKDMIDSMDTLRGLWDAPDAPMNELFATLDQMFGENAGGLSGGSIRKILRNVDATASVLGMDSKELMTALTESGQKAQQAGFNGALGVSIGGQARLVSTSAGRGVLSGRPESLSNISEEDARQYTEQDAYAAFMSSGGKNVMAAFQLGGIEGRLGAGTTNDERKLRDILSKGIGSATAEERAFVTDLESSGKLTGMMGNLGVSARQMEITGEDVATNQDFMNTPEAQQMFREAQVNEAATAMARTMAEVADTTLGDLNAKGEAGNALRLQTIKDLAERGANTEEDVEEYFKEKGISANAGSVLSLLKSSAADAYRGSRAPGHSAWQGMQVATSGTRELDEEIRIERAAQSDLEALGVSGGKLSPTAIAQRLLSGFMDENSDMSAEGMLNQAVNGMNMQKAERFARGSGNVDMLTTVADIDKKMTQYSRAEELDKKIADDEQLLKRVRAAGGETGYIEESLNQYRAERAGIGDVSSFNARRDRRVMEGQRAALTEAHKGLWSNSSAAGDLEQLETMQKTAGTANDEIDEIIKQVEEGTLTESEGNAALQDVLNALVPKGAMRSVETAYGEGGRAKIAANIKATKTVMDTEGSTLRQKAEAAKRLTGSLTDLGKSKDDELTAAAINVKVAKGEMTPEEAAPLLKKLRIDDEKPKPRRDAAALWQPSDEQVLAAWSKDKSESDLDKFNVIANKGPGEMTEEESTWMAEQLTNMGKLATEQGANLNVSLSETEQAAVERATKKTDATAAETKTAATAQPTAETATTLTGGGAAHGTGTATFDKQTNRGSEEFTIDMKLRKRG